MRQSCCCFKLHSAVHYSFPTSDIVTSRHVGDVLPCSEAAIVTNFKFCLKKTLLYSLNNFTIIRGGYYYQQLPPFSLVLQIRHSNNFARKLSSPVLVTCLVTGYMSQEGLCMYGQATYIFGVLCTLRSPLPHFIRHRKSNPNS